MASEMWTEKEHTNSIGMRFVKIEAGSFQRGAEPTPLPDEVAGKPHRRQGDFDERPAHRVTISQPFYLGVYEVTNAQYEQFDPAHRSLRGKLGFSRADDEAVVFVSWFQDLLITDASGQSRPVSGLFGAVSFDEGETWPIRRLITDDGPGRPVETTDGDLFTLSGSSAEPWGYLSVCQAADGVIHLISSRQHYAFNLAWLTTPPPPLPLSPGATFADP
jgi:hypothetical protein